LARSAIAEDIEVGIRLTPPYGKSAIEVQMRHAIAAMQDRSVFQRKPAPDLIWGGDPVRVKKTRQIKNLESVPIPSERKRLSPLHNACTNLPPRWLNAG
jgi:hypothetical protein